MPSKTVEGPCASAAADEGFVNVRVAAASTVIVADFVSMPSGPAVEAVHGLARGSADAYDDLAVAFRFAPSGVIQVLDGDIYRAETPFAYLRGTSYAVRVIADLASQTYSVTTIGGDDERVVLARNFRFAAHATQLDTLATIVRSDTGSVDVCGASESPDVIFRRPGAHAVVPLAGDTAIISDGTTTTHVGAAGETLATFVRGGELAVDPSGNIYVAHSADETLTVDALSADLAPLWSQTYAAPLGASVAAVAVTSAGDVNVLLSHNTMFTLRSIAAGGTSRWMRDLNAVAATPNRTGFALARTTSSTVTVEQFDRDGNPVWSRSWPNTVDVQQIATSATGQVIFSGAYTGTIDFGGLAFAAEPGGANGVKNAYVVALSPAGQHVFSNRIGEQTVTAIASNGTQTIVAAHHSIGPLMTTRYTFDPSGAITDWREGLAGFGWFGRTYQLAVSTSGRVYWSYGPSWPDNFTEWPQLVAY